MQRYKVVSSGWIEGAKRAAGEIILMNARAGKLYEIRGQLERVSSSVEPAVKPAVEPAPTVEPAVAAEKPSKPATSSARRRGRPPKNANDLETKSAPPAAPPAVEPAVEPAVDPAEERREIPPIGLEIEDAPKTGEPS